MLSMVLYPEGKLILEKRSIPEPGRKEALIKLKRCGICMSDYLLSRCEFPLNKPVVLGHEFSGVVERAGEEVNEFKKGSRVTVNPTVSCGNCSYCLKGQTNLCDKVSSLGGVGRTIMDGGFQEYTVVPQHSLAKLDTKIPFEAGTFIEPLGCVIHGIEKAGISPGEVILIIGAGPMGLLLIQFSKLKAPSKIIVSEPSPYRSEIARKLGADLVLNPDQVDIVSEIRKILGGVDLAIEAVGKTGTIEVALASTKKGGRILIFGVPPKGATIPLDVFSLYLDEKEAMGCYSTTDKSFYQALQLINAGKIATEELISHRFSLRELPYALRLQGEGQGLKKMILFD